MEKISPEDWKAVFALLDTVLDLSVEERRRWFASLDAHHSELKPAVRELLTRHANLETGELGRREVLDQLPQFTEVNLGTRGASSAHLGDRVGAYELVSVLGRGGMGEVWLANRADGRFEGRCAIKFLDAASAPKLIERFRTEAQVLARLAHPNIARLIDAGATPDGRPYLALEYVDGERIDAYCDRKRLSVDDRVRLFGAVVAAVAHAHSQLVIHRDLKPSNVLVTREGTVKLLDFGIAKLIAGPGDDPSRTQIDDVALTPDFASPEQLLGEAPTTATDVYQLGLLLYVLLTGRHPFTAGGTRADRIRAVLERDIARASELADSSRRRILRGDLDAILTMALRRAPHERFATAQALADELGRYLQHEPVAARRGAALYRARKFFARHRVAATVSLVAVFSICAALVFSLMQMNAARTQRDQARFAASRAEMSNEFMNLMLSEVGSGERTLTMPELLERTEQMLKKQYGESPAFVAAMSIELAGRYRDVSRYDKAVALLTEAAHLAESVGDDALQVRALCASSRSRFDTDKPELAADDFAKVEPLFARLRAPSIEIQVECLRARAELARSKANFPETLRLLNVAHEMQERGGATKTSQYASVLNEIGGLHLQTGSAPEAYAAFKQADEAFERNGRAGTVAKLTQESNLAIPLTQMGEVLESARLTRHVLERSAALGSYQSSRLGFVINYAHLLIRLDQHDAALQLLDGAADQVAAEEDPTIAAWAKFQMGKARFGLGQHAAAERLVDEAQEVLEKEPTRNGLLLRALKLEGARQALVRGSATLANERIESLLRDLNYPEGRKNVELRNTLQTAAAIRLAIGDPVAADRYVSEAYAIAMKLARAPERSADVGEALLLRARIQNALGDQAQNRELLRRAVQSLTNGLGAEHHLTREAAGLLASQRT